MEIILLIVLMAGIAMLPIEVMFSERAFNAERFDSTNNSYLSTEDLEAVRKFRENERMQER